VVLVVPYLLKYVTFLGSTLVGTEKDLASRSRDAVHLSSIYVPQTNDKRIMEQDASNFRVKSH
jgi:hypothetical protein